MHVDSASTQIKFIAPSKLKLVSIKENKSIWTKSTLLYGYNSWFGVIWEVQWNFFVDSILRATDWHKIRFIAPFKLKLLSLNENSHF